MIDKALGLFRAVRAKDVFEEYYKKDLSKRLLLGRSASDDLERRVLSRLKAECGAAYTSKMEGMFKDIAAGRDTMAAFRGYLRRALAGEVEHPLSLSPGNKGGPGGRKGKGKGTGDEDGGKGAAVGQAGQDSDGDEDENGDGDEDRSGTGDGTGSAAMEDGGAEIGALRCDADRSLPPSDDISVHTLTTTHWPVVAKLTALVPRELDAPRRAFENWYLGVRHTGRRLTWQLSLGHCLLQGQFPRGKKELVVSMAQAIVLLCFNREEAGASGRLTYEQMRGMTCMEPEADLRLTLASLCLGKARVVRKEKKGTSIGEGDAFLFNSEFRHQLRRLRINAIQARETERERKETDERVEQQRVYQTDACIVRIMKSRKSLGHAELIAEVFGQLRFPAKAADVKKRIGSLIERDYLERDEEDGSMYHYVA